MLNQINHATGSHTAIAAWNGSQVALKYTTGFTSMEIVMMAQMMETQASMTSETSMLNCKQQTMKNENQLQKMQYLSRKSLQNILRLDIGSALLQAKSWSSTRSQMKTFILP